MLKESGELDQLLADLLLCMEIEPISRAQVGVRQYGVDIAAVGPDPEDANNTIPPEIETPPMSLIPSYRRDVSPEDEGVHFDKSVAR